MKKVTVAMQELKNSNVRVDIYTDTLAPAVQYDTLDRAISNFKLRWSWASRHKRGGFGDVLMILKIASDHEASLEKSGGLLAPNFTFSFGSSEAKRRFVAKLQEISVAPSFA